MASIRDSLKDLGAASPMIAHQMENFKTLTKILTVVYEGRNSLIEVFMD